MIWLQKCSGHERLETETGAWAWAGTGPNQTEGTVKWFQGKLLGSSRFLGSTASNKEYFLFFPYKKL